MRERKRERENKWKKILSLSLSLHSLILEKLNAHRTREKERGKMDDRENDVSLLFKGIIGAPMFLSSFLLPQFSRVTLFRNTLSRLNAFIVNAINSAGFPASLTTIQRSVLSFFFFEGIEFAKEGNNFFRVVGNRLCGMDDLSKRVPSFY